MVSPFFRCPGKPRAHGHPSLGEKTTVPNLRPAELFQAVVDACRHRTDAVLYVEGQNPYTLSVDGQTVTIFAANVSRAYRIDPDEYRIQCPGDLPQELERQAENGRAVFVMGYNADSDTFSAWEPGLFVRRSRRTQRFSLYTRLSSHLRASADGLAIYRDSTGQNVLQFRSQFLGLYLAHSEAMHQATERDLRRIVAAYRETRSGAISKKSVSVAKRRIEVTHSQYARSPQFRQAVLNAYGNCCAMCGIQLELIEAAHLVPHAHPRGLDVVPNGVALCNLHHKSLDTGLLYIDAGYSIRTNSVRLGYLARMQRTEGLRRFERQLRTRIALPQDPADFPLRENIELGNQLRGIEVV